MELEVKPAAYEESQLLRNLMQLYLYDFSELAGDDVNAFGMFSFPYLDHYWTDPGRFPFLIWVGGKPAGFIMLRRGSYFTQGEAKGAPLPMLVAEFFILRKYRRQGLGARAARWIFDLFPGRWEVAEIPENSAAQAFWREVIGAYTAGRFEEHLLDDERWQGPVQVFDNSHIVGAQPPGEG